MRKKKLTLKKEQIQEAFINTGEITYPVYSLFIISVLIHLSFIFYFVYFVITTKIFIVVGNIFNLLLVLGTLAYFFVFYAIYGKNTLQDFYNMNRDDVQELANDFVNFFDEKHRKRTKRIKPIINRIESAKHHFNRYRKFYKINFGIQLYFIIFYTPFYLSQFSSITKNYESASNVLLFPLIINYYLLTVFIFGFINLRNLERSRDLFMIAFNKELSEIINNLNKRLRLKISDIDRKELLELLNNWYDYYLGIFRNNEMISTYLSENRGFYIDSKKENEFYELFKNLKVKIQDGLYQDLESIKNKDFNEELQILLLKINNYLELLEHRTKQNKLREEKNQKRWNLFRIITYLIATILGIIITINIIFLDIISY